MPVTTTAMDTTSNRNFAPIFIFCNIAPSLWLIYRTPTVY